MNKKFKDLAKEHFINTALSYLGQPYIWGGDDPSGIDCSGLVVECLKTIGFLKETEDFTADSLYRFFIKKQQSDKSYRGFKPEILESPIEAALIFWIKGDYVTHTAICLNEYFYIGANGGDSKTVNVEIANQQNAFVKIRPIKYNSDKQCLINIFDTKTVQFNG